MSLFKLFHLMAAMLWVGGIFFTHVVLRPSMLEILEAERRLRLWDAVLMRFFHWVWGAVGVLMVTGFFMVYLAGGVGHETRRVQIMIPMALSMVGIFVYVFFFCYVPMNVHLSKQRWLEAEILLGRIRGWVTVNLLLGLSTITIAATGIVGE